MIFVNYRGTDQRNAAAQIYTLLKKAFGAKAVFLDRHSIQPGDHYPTTIHRHLEQARVLLVVMGPNWLGGGGGSRSIDEPGDWVRREIAEAFQRNIRVIPVLLDDARMPAPSELPGEIRGLPICQQVRVDSYYVARDVESLVDGLAGAIPALNRRRRARRAKRMASFIAGTVVAVGGSIFAATGLFGEQWADASPTRSVPTYQLWPSSGFATNNADKVDLDTGCPGWGNTFPKVGPPRCGEKADLILEEDSVHTYDNSPKLVLLPNSAEADHDTCKDALSTGANPGVGSVSRGRLPADAPCVWRPTKVGSRRCASRTPLPAAS